MSRTADITKNTLGASNWSRVHCAIVVQGSKPCAGRAGHGGKGGNLRRKAEDDHGPGVEGGRQQILLVRQQALDREFLALREPQHDHVTGT